MITSSYKYSHIILSSAKWRGVLQYVLYFLVCIYIEMIEKTWQTSGDHEPTNVVLVTVHNSNDTNITVPVGCFQYVTVDHPTFNRWLFNCVTHFSVFLHTLHSCYRLLHSCYLFCTLVWNKLHWNRQIKVVHHLYSYYYTLYALDKVNAISNVFEQQLASRKGSISQLHLSKTEFPKALICLTWQFSQHSPWLQAAPGRSLHVFALQHLFPK